MPIITCDMVNCIYNKRCVCNACIIEITLNHVGEVEIIECATYQKEEVGNDGKANN